MEAVRAGVFGEVVPPESGVVAVAGPGLEAEEPLMPNKPLVTEGTPSKGVELVMCVGGDELVCPDLMGGQDSFAEADDVSRCRENHGGGGYGQGGTNFSVGVGHLVELMSHVPLYPLEGLAWA